MTMNIKQLLSATGSESQRDLARQLGVSQNCVWRWFRVGYVSAEGALAIERLTKGKIDALELRKVPHGKHGNRRRADRGPRKKARPAVSEPAGA